MDSEGIPVWRGLGVRTVLDLPLQDWERKKGGRGSYIQTYGTETKWGHFVVEVPAGGALTPEKHLFEEIYLAVEGRGTCEVWQEGDVNKHVFEWQRGSMFSIPMNAWFRIVNATPRPAVLMSGNTAPNVLNQLNNVEAVFNNDFIFRDRFSGADDFYKYREEVEPDPVRGLAMRRTNFIPDVVDCDLPLDNRRSPGYRRVEPMMTNNQFYYWVAQHENGRYSKAHAHTSAAILVRLKGNGYTHAARISRPHPVGRRQGRPGPAPRLRAVRLHHRCARGPALVPPALLGLQGAVPSQRLVRPAQPGS